MNQFVVFVRKEFKHILRDYRTMLVLFGMPVVQILIFGFALSTEVKESGIAVLNESGELISQQLIDEFQASKYFEVDKILHSNSEIESALQSRNIKAVLVLPLNMQSELAHLNQTSVQIITDGSDPNVANTLVNYTTGIIRDFQKRMFPFQKLPLDIQIETRMLYNPQLIGAYMFVPGVISLILMLICTLMTSVAIVKEKEFGSMEVLLVSPMRKLTFVVSKAIPYLVLSWIIVVIIFLLSVFVLEVPIKGNLLLLFLECTLYILTCLALGLLISNFTKTQQAAMLISLIGLMLPTIMLSGFMFPVENMPLLLQWLSNLVPAKWFFYITKSLMVKGSGVEEIWEESLILAGFMILFMAISIYKFKIRLE